MSILFASSEDIDFINAGGVVNTVAGSYRANYARSSLRCNNTASGWNLAHDGISDLWFSCYAQTGSFGTNGLITFGSPSVGSVRLVIPSSGLPTVQVYESGAWSAAKQTSSTALSTSVLYKLTIHVSLSSSGRFELWVNDSQHLDWSGDTVGSSGLAALDYVQLRAAASGGSTYYSEVIVADAATGEAIRALSIATLYPAANGNYTGWTGDYTAVDEATNSDADYVSAPVADQVESFTLSDLPATTDVPYEVRVSARAMRGAVGPQGVQLLSRSGGVDALSATKTPPAAWGAVAHTFSTAPDGGSWTADKVNALEVGVKSVA